MSATKVLSEKSGRFADGRTWRALILALLLGGTAGCPTNLDYLDSAPARDDAGDANSGFGGGPQDASDAAPADETEVEPDAAGADGGELDAASDVIDEDGGTGPVNLIRNPGFELGTTPWTTFSDGTSVAMLEASPAHAHSGSFSGHVSNRTKSYQGAVQEIHGLVMPGHTYQVSAWALLGSADDAGLLGPQPTLFTAAVTCLVDGGQMTNYFTIGTSTANATSWTPIGGVLTVPSCSFVFLYLYVEGPAPGIDLYIDDTSVTP